MQRLTHFIGCRTDSEFLAAIRAFGRPDFIHRAHDRRALEEIHPADLVIIFRKATLTPVQRTFQDHEHF